MNFLLFLDISICSIVNILHEGDENLRLVVIKKENGGKIVRLVNTNGKLNFDYTDSFEVLDAPSKIMTDEGFICGKLTDSGVVFCNKEQTEKSIFTFENSGKGFKVKADNGQCLTKTAKDGTTNGFYVNLRACNSSVEQKFIKSEIKRSSHAGSKYEHHLNDIDPQNIMYGAFDPYNFMSNGYRTSKQQKYFSGIENDIGLATRKTTSSRSYKRFSD
ncbi:hypothetical protein NGRA_2665 [Nosema granulosis]|uniref:Uncharacterized protein n=1 Tax=Nosema granulosis TaxID=83296 RepID=A0A9P6KXZ3_9MICR|nr:hypothetical protein NGRA_2665 [Nosema granulosis]